jgi:hypothetical protein
MKRIFSLIGVFSYLFSTAQVGPYSWQDHLSLNSCNSVCRFNSKIYGSNYNGIVKVDEEEGSTERLNKINGLNDVGVRLLRVNPFNNKLLVIYDNSNIDIIDQNDQILNYPDIKLKTISGKKGINEVFFKGKFAYLATGLGIILFDTELREIKDTYIIGPGGNQLEVFQVALNDSLIFAATANGLYRSNYKTKVLNNFNNWKLVSPLPTGIYSGVVSVDGKVLAAYSPSKADPGKLIDTLYILENNNWARFLPSQPDLIKKLSYVSGSQFTIMGQFGPKVMDVNTKVMTTYITSFNGKDFDPRDIIFFEDKGGIQSYWVADVTFGLFETYGYHPYYEQHLKSINGTNKSYVSNIDVLNGAVAVSPSFPSDGGGSSYIKEGINIFKDHNWSYIPSRNFNGNAILDINAVYFDRKDNTRMWASSWDIGLLEYKNQELVAIYGATNTPFGQFVPGSIRISGLSMDSDGNLWIASSDAAEFLSVRRKNGSFVTFNFSVQKFTRRILVDKNNYVWALHERDGGITVFKHDNFGPAVENVNYRVLSKEGGKGNLGSNAVYSIVEDKEGKIWVGTSAGIRVFYNPKNIFSNGSYDAQPIKIVQDGNVELLLENETVSALTVDGANNKWVGTQTGGLYCFSPDGLRELYHFTKDNSPLYSNNIVDLNYNKLTGDIFIGSELGLQSFRSVFIEGGEDFQNVYAYPNPVRPNYTGHVFVRGLIDNSVVKITDESGNLVWEAKSHGGQIEWPIKTLSGNRVTTGVYVVYASSTDGSLRALTKVLVVN